MTNSARSLIDETAGQMLQRLGTDGMLWAQEMHKHFPSVSVADFLGWCCNMIEAGGDRERRANKPVSVSLQEIRNILNAFYVYDKASGSRFFNVDGAVKDLEHLFTEAGVAYAD